MYSDSLSATARADGAVAPECLCIITCMSTLGDVSRETSRAIYDDAFGALDDLEHPCHHFVGTQVAGVPDGWLWQLPIPFMGRRAGKGVVFMSLNPSYGPGDDPTVETPFDDYDTFWRAYFETHVNGLHFLYQRQAEIGRIALGDGFRMGDDALVVELIRFRSVHSEGLFSDGPPFRVFQHERPLTMQVLQDIQPKVIHCGGADVLWGIGELFPQLNEQLSFPTHIRQEEGRIYFVDTPWGRTAIAPSRHLTGSIPSPNHEDRARIARSIREALADLG